MADRKFLKKTETYKAIDAAGKQHDIDVYTEFIEVDLIDGSTESAEGMKSHKMAANGNHVNVDDDDTLEEVKTGRKMRRVPVA